MYKTYGIIIPNSLPTWKPTVIQKHTLTGSNGRLKKSCRLWIQRNGHAIRMYIWNTPKHHIALIISAISGLSSGPLSSLMFMADTRMEDADMSFLKEVLIRYCQQYLTSEEIQKLKESLTNGENTLTLCDKAIGMLALYTGLRGCDIAGMTLDSIDWDRDLIYIRQQKTELPLELPLTAVVGNAIYDYLTSERPHTENKYLFVSQHKPYDRLKNRSIGNMAVRIMKATGIRQSKGDRKGFHIFRHHLATALLRNGVPQPVISRTLGHTSPDSLEAYLSADFPHLKECSITIEHFPVPEEVFSHE
jgi:site-specific recombinase XerD